MKGLNITIVDIEDTEGKVFKAHQVLALKQEELAAAQKAVEEAEMDFRLTGAHAVQEQGIKLPNGSIIYSPKFDLTFISDGEDITCVGAGISENYEKFN